MDTKDSTGIDIKTVQQMQYILDEMNPVIRKLRRENTILMEENIMLRNAKINIGVDFNNGASYLAGHSMEGNPVMERQDPQSVKGHFPEDKLQGTWPWKKKQPVGESKLQGMEVNRVWMNEMNQPGWPETIEDRLSIALNTIQSQANKIKNQREQLRILHGQVGDVNHYEKLLNELEAEVIRLRNSVTKKVGVTLEDMSGKVLIAANVDAEAKQIMDRMKEIYDHYRDEFVKKRKDDAETIKNLRNELTMIVGERDKVLGASEVKMLQDDLVSVIKERDKLERLYQNMFVENSDRLERIEELVKERDEAVRGFDAVMKELESLKQRTKHMIF